METYNDFTTTNALNRWVLQRPDEIFIIDEGNTVTFKEFDVLSNKLANWLTESGVKKNDNIGVLLNNKLELVISMVAAHKIGAVVSFWNFRLSSQDIGKLINFVKAKVVIFESEFWDKVEQLKDIEEPLKYLCIGKKFPQVDEFNEVLQKSSPQPPSHIPLEKDYASVIYTAGTTGLPKGAAFSHEAHIFSAMQYAIEMGITRDSIGLAAAPLIHGAALNFLMAYLFVGAKFVVLKDRKALSVLETMEKHRVSELFAVPTQTFDMLKILREGKFKLSDNILKLIRSGGSSATKEMVEDIHKLFKCHYQNTFGMTECLSNVTYMDSAYTPPEKWHTIGQAGFFWEARAITLDTERIVKPEEKVSIPGTGQLIVRGPQNISSYYMNPDAGLGFDRGWLYTRDVVEIDDNGYLKIIDRVDESILSGAENIFPQEVETVLVKHPQIEIAVVFGLPDQKWGEKVAACVKVTDPSTFNVKELEEFLAGMTDLAKYKRPKVVIVVDEISRNILGKLERGKVKKEFLSKFNEGILLEQPNVYTLG